MDLLQENELLWLHAKLPGARVGFSTRLGGVSSGPYESLNLGVLTDDDRDGVLENRGRLAGALGRDTRDIAIGRQVHGAELADHRERHDPPYFAEPSDRIPEVDGHLISGDGGAALVFVADCLPVALSGPGGLALLHCGWRGMAAGIIGRGAAAIGATDAAVGPGIGRCCYEVGPEVLDAFAPLGEGIAEGSMLDLPEVATRLLREAGVERVEASDLCTSCERDLFFSHRRDGGITGRQAGVLWGSEED